MIKADICIIGAGPAGITAAIFAANPDIKIVILDSNTTTARKLLHTGKQRCNFTHTGSISEFLKQCQPFANFLRPALYQFSPQNVIDFFQNAGLETKIEKDGCLFPASDRATDIKNILVEKLKLAGVKTLLGKKVTSIEKLPDHFLITADPETVEAKKLIIATGGCSWPHTGSTGDGLIFAKKLGHNIIPPFPALAPLVTEQAWPKKLAGLPIPLISITATIDDKKIQATGPAIFTHDGVGGPAVFNFSRLIADTLAKNIPVNANIDLVPSIKTPDLEKKFIDLCAHHPKRETSAITALLIPRALAETLSEQLKLKNITANQLSKKQRAQLVKLLKSLPLTITSPAPIKQATITRGGIDTKQIDPKTMLSKICPSLYFAGETINVDGPTGGYNLQIAWSTGALAGLSAAKALNENTNTGKIS